MKTKARGIQADDEVWAELCRMGEMYGSKNAALRELLWAKPKVIVESRHERLGVRPLRVKGDGKR